MLEGVRQDSKRFIPTLTNADANFVALWLKNTML